MFPDDDVPVGDALLESPGRQQPSGTPKLTVYYSLNALSIEMHPDVEISMAKRPSF
jgi:hypothetical protein